TIEIRHALAPDLWPVLIDIGQIETALLNIALNARDALPGGGMVLIETANIGATREELPEEVAGQDCVLLSVRDTGTGMPPEVLERAFEPFFTTKEVGKGTGLGLSMVYGMARQSGGAARIESTLGVGTAVKLLFRKADGQVSEASAGVEEPQPTQAAGAGRSILVVDDDPDVRGFIVEALEEQGYLVREAADGREGIAEVEREAPDLIVLDFIMPGLSGADVARHAR